MEVRVIVDWTGTLSRNLGITKAVSLLTMKVSTDDGKTQADANEASKTTGAPLNDKTVITAPEGASNMSVSKQNPTPVFTASSCASSLPVIIIDDILVRRHL